MKFHKAMGFIISGAYQESMYKFGQWRDVLWMGKSPRPHEMCIRDRTIGDVFTGTRVGNAGLGQRGKAGCAARTCVRKAGLQFSGAGLRRLLHRGADGQRGQSLPGTLGVYQRDYLRGVAAVRGSAL